MSNFRKQTTKRLLAILTLLLQVVGLTTATAQGMDSGACGGRDTVVSIFFALPKAIFTPPHRA